MIFCGGPLRYAIFLLNKKPAKRVRQGEGVRGRKSARAAEWRRDARAVDGGGLGGKREKHVQQEKLFGVNAFCTENTKTCFFRPASTLTATPTLQLTAAATSAETATALL